MTEEKKNGTAMKSLSVEMKLVFEDGSKSVGSFKSHLLTAKRPATPAETAITAAGELARYAAYYDNQGAEAIRVVMARVALAHAAKVKQGLDAGPDPRLETLFKLAEGQGYDLIKSSAKGKGHLADLAVKESRETSSDTQVEEAWERTWKDIVIKPDGTVDLDQLKLELSDFSMLISHVSRVYDHATGGRVSKPLTWPSVVCSVIDDHFQDQVPAIEHDAVQAYRDATWKRDNGWLICVLATVGYNVPIKTISDWSDEQAQQAEEWAMAEQGHIPGDQQIQRPDFLAPYADELAAEKAGDGE